MSEAPDYAAMLDKEFGSAATPPDAAADKAEQQPLAEVEAPDTALAPEGPTTQEQIDAAGILRHADYTRKMQALAREREQIAELAELKNQLDADPELRERFVAAWENAHGQAAPTNGQAPAAEPNTAALNARIARLERTLAEQSFSSHAGMVSDLAGRIGKEHGLTDKDIVAVIAKADRLGMVKPGTPPDVIEEQLRAVAAMTVLPRAKADGQRELIGQLKEKGKAASPVVERPIPPEPEPDYGKMGEQAFVQQLIREAERGQGKP